MNKYELDMELAELCSRRKVTNERISQLTKELDEAEAQESRLSACLDAAKELKALKDCFVVAGFSDEEAFNLVMHMIPGGQPTPTIISLLEELFS